MLESEQEKTRIMDIDGVNCYLLPAADGFVLVDTGFANRRTRIENELTNRGCRPGNLKLIIITHGDSDHTGNAVYLRQKFGAPIAMHRGDVKMVKEGDLLANRQVNFFIRVLFGLIVLTPFGLNRNDRFTPDLFIDESWDVNRYGLDARIIHIPGHSAGSIGLLTFQGDLFCGDLFMNKKGRPIFSSFYIDKPQGRASLEKLKSLKIKTVYPGHGSPFTWDQLLKNQP